MKPLGPIPPGFGTFAGELAIDGIAASALVEQAGGTPLFVYSGAMIRRRIADLRAAMPKRVALHYAVKANPYEPALKLFDTLVDGFDIASGGELALLRAAGIDPARVSFAGPGKRDAELEAAIAAGVTLNLESESEAERALVIGERLGVVPRLAIRVNPAFDLKGSGMKMGGGAKPFGLDAERVPALARRVIAAGAEWRGLPHFCRQPGARCRRHRRNPGADARTRRAACRGQRRSPAALQSRRRLWHTLFSGRRTARHRPYRRASRGAAGKPSAGAGRHRILP